MGARRGIAAAATRMRRPHPGWAAFVGASLALLVVAVAQGRQTQQPAVTLELLATPIGAIDATKDLDDKTVCEDGSQVCQFRYAAGTTVHLTARVTDQAHPFYGWSTDECAGTECDVPLSGEEPTVSVFALFEQPQIVVAMRGAGTVSWPGGQCVSTDLQTCATDQLPARTPVEFTATPGVGAAPTLWAFGCEPIAPDKCVARPENRNVGVSFDGTPRSRPGRAWAGPVAAPGPSPAPRGSTAAAATVAASSSTSESS